MVYIAAAPKRGYKLVLITLVEVYSSNDVEEDAFRFLLLAEDNNESSDPSLSVQSVDTVVSVSLAVTSVSSLSLEEGKVNDGLLHSKGFGDPRSFFSRRRAALSLIERATSSLRHLSLRERFSGSSGGDEAAAAAALSPSSIASILSDIVFLEGGESSVDLELFGCSSCSWGAQDVLQLVPSGAFASASSRILQSSSSCQRRDRR